MTELSIFCHIDCGPSAILNTFYHGYVGFYLWWDPEFIFRGGLGVPPCSDHLRVTHLRVGRRRDSYGSSEPDNKQK